MAILEALLISSEKCETNIYTNSTTAIQAISKSKKGKAREQLKSTNTAILKAIKLIVETKNISLVLHKIKAHTGIKENEIADIEAKKGTEEETIVRVQQTQIKIQYLVPYRKEQKLKGRLISSLKS